LTRSADLSIIIVNWNSADYLRLCLRSLNRQMSRLEIEVIVVENASNDGCPAVIREEFPSARLIEAGENLGFSRANNLGYRYSSGDILLFLNPDTEVIGDTLGRMVSYMRSDARLGAAGARLLNSDGSLQFSCVQAFPTISNQVLDFDFLRRRFPGWTIWGTHPLFSELGQPAEVETISGACFMVKRSVFEQVGLFGEQYFMYSDDLDLSYRIRKAGYRIVCLNDCLVTHHGGKSSETQGKYFADVLQRESLTRFFLTTRGRLYCWGYRAAMINIAVIRLALVVCLIPFRGVCLVGKESGFAFRKWFTILRWAVGFQGWRRADDGSRAASNRTR
jgi:GT2 family glycosyltransferase